MAVPPTTQSRPDRCGVAMPFLLRHAFASQLIANGCDVGTVARLLGHSSPQMVYQHYQHVSTVQKRAAVATLEATSVWQAGMAKK
ncbi:MAG: hypothetical protein E7022_04375 [Desulfovibrio desulfuricans]|nr:hypothetical protein [Desulfovibrio desulfuricans]